MTVRADPAPRLTRELIALRVARLLQPGWVVNLGVGLPTMVAQFLDPESGVVLHVESGVLGAGPPGDPPHDPDLIDAGARPIALWPGASLQSSSESFAAVRGGHIDAAVLGAMEVSEHGDLANWRRPGRGLGGIGGAIDIAQSARRVVAAMAHTGPNGVPRLVRECSLPLTGRACVDVLVTDVALVRFDSGDAMVHELAEGWSFDDVEAISEARLRPAAEIRALDL